MEADRPMRNLNKKGHWIADASVVEYHWRDAIPLSMALPTARFHEYARLKFGHIEW